MEGFQVLPTEAEFVQWLEDEVFKDELGIMSLVLEGFQFLSIDTYCKKMPMTEHQDQAPGFPHCHEQGG